MHRFGLGRLTPLILIAAAACGASSVSLARAPDGEVTTAAGGIRHVFLIVLENKSFSDTFGTSTQDPYLQQTLVPMGALLKEYYGTGHVSLDNYIAMISGQSPTPDTDNDCSGQYTDVQQTGTTRDGQVIAAHGCIYSSRVKNIANQLTEAGLTWKAYMEDMGNDPARESATCGHPAIGSADNTSAEEAPSAAVPQGDAYATRHDPFMYFHSIIDSPTCKTHVVNLSHLTEDLARERTTPNFSFITPNLCSDAHDGSGTGSSNCANGQPGGLTSADEFLRTWVPRILASPAYRRDGLLIITFDESNFTVEVNTDPTTGVTTTDITFPGDTCCDQQPGPNLEGIRPGSVELAPNLYFVFGGYGGDRVGALLLSPFIKPGSNSETPYNHYSLLRSLEDIFKLHGYLGYAANNPRTGYHLNTIGNDRAIFQHDYDPSFEHRHDPWYFPWYRRFNWL